MLGTDIRGIIAEEEEVQRRKDALKSLLSMRSKQLRESLEQRIKRAKAEQAKAQVQIVYYEQIAALRVQQTTVRDKLAEMRQATGEAWESVKVGFDSAWTELKSGLAGAAAKFK